MTNKRVQQLYCPADEFTPHRTSPHFRRLVTLARIVNSLRFTEIAGVEQNHKEGPSPSRQRVSAFLYMAALLYEGLRFAKRIAKDFQGSPAYRTGFSELLRDPEVRSLRDGLLARLRNQAIYHHDDEVAELGLQLLNEPEYVFVSTSGRTNADFYYDLADLTVVRFAINEDLDRGEFYRRFKEEMERTVAVAFRFSECADRLIVEGLKDLGWKNS